MGTIEGLDSQSLPFIEPVGLLFDSVLSPRCKRLLVRYWWGVDVAGLLRLEEGLTWRDRRVMWSYVRAVVISIN